MILNDFLKACVTCNDNNTNRMKISPSYSLLMPFFTVNEMFQNSRQWLFWLELWNKIFWHCWLELSSHLFLKAFSVLLVHNLATSHLFVGIWSKKIKSCNSFVIKFVSRRIFLQKFIFWEFAVATWLFAECLKMRKKSLKVDGHWSGTSGGKIDCCPLICALAQTGQSQDNHLAHTTTIYPQPCDRAPLYMCNNEAQAVCTIVQEHLSRYWATNMI